MGQIFSGWEKHDTEQFIVWTMENGKTGQYWQTLYEIVGYLYLTQQEYENALSLFQSLYDGDHRNTFTIRSLAGIHAKQGRMAAAHKLLRLLN